MRVSETAFCNKREEASGFSKGITQRITAPESVHLITNTVNTIQIPSCVAPNTSGDVTISVTTAPGSGYESAYKNGGTRCSPNALIELRDSNDNLVTLNAEKCIPEESTDDQGRRLTDSICVDYDLALYSDDEIDALVEESWSPDSDVPHAFQCNGWTGTEWSDDGFDSTKTFVNLTEKIAHCCATQQHQEVSVSFISDRAASSVTEVDSNIIIVRPKGSSDGDSDDYEYLSSFNPLYLSLILIVVGGVLVVGLQIRDNLYSAKDLVDSVLVTDRCKRKGLSMGSDDEMMKAANANIVQTIQDPKARLSNQVEGAYGSSWDGEVVVRSHADSVHSSLPHTPGENPQVAWQASDNKLIDTYQPKLNDTA